MAIIVIVLAFAKNVAADSLLALIKFLKLRSMHTFQRRMKGLARIVGRNRALTYISHTEFGLLSFIHRGKSLVAFFADNVLASGYLRIWYFVWLSVGGRLGGC